LSTLLAGDSHVPTTQPDFKGALKWLQRLTLLLQNAQRALYGVRHIELLSERRAATAATVIVHRCQRPQSRTRTLYQAWKLQYTRPFAPRRKHVSAQPVLGASPVTYQATGCPDHQMGPTLSPYLPHSQCDLDMHSTSSSTIQALQAQ
jgi:hypothetical protein